MEINFRPLSKEDFPLFASWLGKPFVNKWWREPATVEFVDKEYGDCTRGDFKTRVYLVQVQEKPIGIIQVFRLSDYPEYEPYFSIKGAVSIDYLIGEEEFIGKGYGSRMISDFIEIVIKKLYPDATGVATSAETANGASLGALRKAGFTPGEIIMGEFGPERVMIKRF